MTHAAPHPDDLTFARVAPGDYPQLIQRIRGIMEENASHGADAFDRAWWDWQYVDLPTGEARIYAAYDGETIVGYYHVPVYDGQVRGEPKRFGMVQGVAVSPTMRGRGVFKQLANYVTDDLATSGLDLIYTYPNTKSIHTFVKYNGYEHVATYGTYVLPVRSADILGLKVRALGLERIAGVLVDAAFRPFGPRLRPGDEVRVEATVSEAVADVFEVYQRAQDVSLVRDRKYLAWRFGQRPSSAHRIVSVVRGEQVQAAGIFKLDEMFGVPALLLMDLAHRIGEERSLLSLIGALKREPGRYVTDPYSLLFAAGSGPFFRLLPRLGFLPIPERVNPRPIHLLVKNLRVTDSASVFSDEAWQATLADWDVF